MRIMQAVYMDDPSPPPSATCCLSSAPTLTLTTGDLVPWVAQGEAAAGACSGPGGLWLEAPSQQQPILWVPANAFCLLKTH